MPHCLFEKRLVAPSNESPSGNGDEHKVFNVGVGIFQTLLGAWFLLFSVVDGFFVGAFLSELGLFVSFLLPWLEHGAFFVVIIRIIRVPSIIQIAVGFILCFGCAILIRAASEHNRKCGESISLNELNKPILTSRILAKAAALLNLFPLASKFLVETLFPAIDCASAASPEVSGTPSA
jgi:hypothetical protein